eukprot:ANDGO_02861.mRNA.1 hypothetical protein NAEGRDRAFT_80788
MRFSLLVLALVLPFVLCSNVVVYKQLSSDLVGVQQPLTVSLVVYNEGRLPIHNVYLNDSHNWPAEAFTITEGSAVTTVPEVAPGASVNISFVVVPSVEGELFAVPAEYSYEISIKEKEEDEEQLVTLNGRSNFVPPFPVFSARKYAVEASTKQFEWIAFFAMIIFPTLVPAAIYITIRNQRLRAMVSKPKKA